MRVGVKVYKVQVLLGEVSANRSIVSKECDHELARLEDANDASDQLAVVVDRSVGLEADVGAGRLGRDVYGEVVTVGQNGIDRIAARIEQKRVQYGVRKDFINARLLRSLLSRGCILFVENLHYIFVQLGHDDLKSLIGLSNRHGNVQRVEKPIVYYFIRK